MRRWWIWLVGAVVLLGVAAVTASFLINEPVRRYVERQMNAHLQGYSVQIGALDIHPFSFSVDLRDVVIVQEAHPDPPVVRVPALSASVQWRALLSGDIVGDVEVERPAVHLNLAQLRHEARDEVPVQERGWQEAIQAVMPLQINELRVVDGELTYIDADAARPLRLSQLQVRAGNIRNVKSEAGVYPSDLQLEGVLDGSGRIALHGRADFLAVPHAAVQADLTLEQVELAQFQPMAARHNIALKRGVLSAVGTIEYAPGVQVVHLRQATLDRVQADYIHTAQTKAVEKQRVQKVQRVVEEVSNAPGFLVRADQLHMVTGTLGFVNRATRPEYRLSLEDAELHLQNFSNHLTDGTAAAKVTGRFMGTGRTVVGANFRPENQGPDFALAASIEETDMRALNPLLRAYGKFDVVQGVFSMYTEMRLKNRAVQGYVKPLLRELDVYDTHQDQAKGMFQKLYEAVVGGVSEVLENLPRDEVATKVDLSGPLEDPQASTWQALVNLIQNAFFRAILPGFERESGR